MNKYQLLRLRAEELREVLEEYAKKDEDVAFFLKLWMPWYQKIKKREILLPCYDYKLNIYFTNPDLSPLAERYMFNNPQIPLGDAVAKFGCAIRDWLSSPVYLAQLKPQDKKLAIVPDEPPSPEEEIKSLCYGIQKDIKRTICQSIKEYIANFFLAIKEVKKIWLSYTSHF